MEYVWIARRLPRRPGTVWDVGAGISPLPVFLARRGWRVVTSDRSRNVRLPGTNEHEWDGWGFLDYSRFAPSIRSIQGDAREGVGATQLDAAYSVSVLEHLPRAERIEFWDVARSCLKVAAPLLVTLDLVPGTDRLWNLDQGRPVEDEVVHGDVETVRDELVAAGFAVGDVVVERGFADQPATDIALMECQRL